MKYLLTICMLFHFSALAAEVDREAVESELIWHLSKERKEEEKPQTQILGKDLLSLISYYRFAPELHETLIIHRQYSDRIYDSKGLKVERTYYNYFGDFSHIEIVTVSDELMKSYLDELVDKLTSGGFDGLESKLTSDILKDYFHKNPKGPKKEPRKSDDSTAGELHQP